MRTGLAQRSTACPPPMSLVLTKACSTNDSRARSLPSDQVPAQGDSIAKPGAMKDPRFNKDAHEVARLKAARDGVHPAACYGTSQSTDNPSTSGVTPSMASETGKWHVQLPRHHKPRPSSTQGPPELDVVHA
jgi:hypothetical protein